MTMWKIILIIMSLCMEVDADMHKQDRAKAFNLPDLFSSKNYDISNFKGEVILLNLWASWCKGCKNEMPEFFDLQKQYKNGFKIITVSVDNQKDNASHFLKQIAQKKGYKIPLIALYDKEKKMAKSYECEALPSSYLIDKNGVIQEVMVGSLSAEDIKQLKIKIDTLLK